MSDPIPPPKSATRVWLRFLAWTAPGVAVPSLMAAALNIPDGSGILPIVAIALFFLILFGCADFDFRPWEHDPSGKPPSATLCTIGCVVRQVILVPIISVSFALGCPFVVSGI